MVVLGSSTSAGTGASTYANSWVGLLTYRLTNDYPGMVSVSNLGFGGLTTFHILPTGTNNGAFRPAVDQARNITAALALKPQVILINMPTNDVANGFSDTETMNNFATVINAARAAGVKVLLTGTQPRGDIPLASRQRLQSQNTTLLGTYGGDCINVYDELTDFTTYSIKSLYSAGDNVHLNNAGHAYIYSRISAPVKTWVEANSSGFINNDNASSLNGTLIFSTTATTSSPAGSYPIVPSGLTSANYQITFSNGVLTVTPGSGTSTSIIMEQKPLNELSLSAYPNPFTDRLNIRVNSDSTVNTVIELLDTKGVIIHRVYQGELAGAQENNLVMPATGLAKGVYFLRVRVGSHLTHKRLILK